MGTQGSDVAAIIGKGLIGAIPFVGPLAAEIVGTLIPNQRVDRIEALLKILETKLEKEDKEKIKERITSPESVDLIEDAFLQTSRALSDERKEYIASLLKNSLTDEELRHIEYKNLINILGQLNDVEIIILKSFSFISRDDEYRQYMLQHQDILSPYPVTMGSSQQDIDKDTINKAHKTHLVNLGLLRIKFTKPKKGEMPEFDEKTGMVKASGYDITRLGRLLLRSIDQGGELL